MWRIPLKPRHFCQILQIMLGSPAHHPTCQQCVAVSSRGVSAAHPIFHEEQTCQYRHIRIPPPLKEKKKKMQRRGGYCGERFKGPRRRKPYRQRLQFLLVRKVFSGRRHTLRGRHAVSHQPRFFLFLELFRTRALPLCALIAH